ncbi:MAG: hypothetical protein JW715_06670 [Sedimentisphaerales bacterium]|nr:hypothetical protein [Sedimentisphaerales bacterium]
MAKITFTLDELTEILVSNELLPKNIVRITGKGDNVSFYVKTQTFIIPFIPATLKFLSFDNNNVIFELTVISSQINKAIGRLDQLLELKMPEYIKLEHPNIIVNIDKLLQEKNVRGVQVKNVLFENGEFVITTGNS